MTPSRKVNITFIAWEKQRRTISLASQLGAKLAIIEVKANRPLRYLLSFLKTIPLLFAARHSIVIVQNPSMLLAFICVTLRPLFNYKLIIDRHSNFLFSVKGKLSLSQRAFMFLSRFTNKNADLVLVTNSTIASLVKNDGGKPFVLPDPFPTMPEIKTNPKAASFELLFVCSWSDDEPIAELFAAASKLSSALKIYVSGKPKFQYKNLINTKPNNIELTGFVDDTQFFELMARVDAVIAISKAPATLVCGAYEAIALGKPVLVGDSKELKEYFSSGVLYTNSTPEDIYEKIQQLIENTTKLRAEVNKLFNDRSLEWQNSLSELQLQL